MVPNYSSKDDFEKFNALGVTQYGQMTAGSYMYIGPQGIVHGTTITVLNAGRKIAEHGEDLAGKLFLTSDKSITSTSRTSVFKKVSIVSSLLFNFSNNPL